MFSALHGLMRLLEMFSGEVRELSPSHKKLLDSPCHEKKSSFRFWFKFLVLFCLLILFLLCTVCNNTQSLRERFSVQKSCSWVFVQTPRVNAPSYRVHPKHRVKLNYIKENTEPHPVHRESLQYHEAYPHNYQFIMDNTEVCKINRPFLVLMVPVAPKDISARDAIRATWGKDHVVQGKVVYTLFMLGLDWGIDVKDLKKENEQHNDLIQSNFMDTYLNLTIKTMVIMDWLATRCPTADYAMKVDSDMFLNIDNLVIMLKKPGIPKLNYLTGMLMWNRPVIRSKDSKWYVSEEMYPDPQYPTYPLGMGYIFSNDLPAKLVEVSKSVKPFNIEDAYIGMCIKKLGLSLTPPPDSSQFKAYNTQYDRCEFSKIITYILDSSEKLRNYWTDYKKPGPYC